MTGKTLDFLEHHFFITLEHELFFKQDKETSTVLRIGIFDYSKSKIFFSLKDAIKTVQG